MDAEKELLENVSRTILSCKRTFFLALKMAAIIPRFRLLATSASQQYGERLRLQ